MHRSPLARLTAALIGVVATVGVVTAGVRQSEPATLEAGRAVVLSPDPGSSPVLAASTGSQQEIAPSVPAPTTTQAPPPTTAPPTTAAPTTTPPTTAPPPSAPPTTASPAPVATASPAPASSASLSACERELLDRMNAARTSRGTAPMAADGRVVPVSRSWSDHMAAIQDLRHNPDHVSQVRAAAPEATRIAENVGSNAGTVRQLFDTFMASSTHRDAILAPGYTHVGVGCTVDGAGRRWATINFWG